MPLGTTVISRTRSRLPLSGQKRHRRVSASGARSGRLASALSGRCGRPQPLDEAVTCRPVARTPPGRPEQGRAVPTETARIRARAVAAHASGGRCSGSPMGAMPAIHCLRGCADPRRRRPACRGPRALGLGERQGLRCFAGGSCRRRGRPGMTLVRRSAAGRRRDGGDPHKDPPGITRSGVAHWA
jgi:hypothetical protein